MVPLMDRAKLAQLKRLKREMRQIMAETGVEDPEVDPTAEDPIEEEAEGEGGMSPSEHMAHEEAELHGDVPGDEDELTRLKREYFKPKPKAPRPGAGLMIAVEAGPAKKHAPGHKSGYARRGA